MKKEISRADATIATSVKTSSGIALIFLTLVTVLALPVALGSWVSLLAVSLVSPKSFSMALTTDTAKYDFVISGVESFRELQVPLSLDERLNGIGRRGSYVKAVVPKLPQAGDQCANCMHTPIFMNSDNTLDELRNIYPSIFGDTTPEVWESMTLEPSTQLYYECVVQEMRQINTAEKFGFFCGDVSYDEALAIYHQLQEKISGLGKLVYTPDFNYFGHIAQTQSWGRGIFDIFYETTWLPKIDSFDQLFWLLGFDISEIPYGRPVLFILPKYPEVNEYCQPLVDEGIACLKDPIFTSTEYYWHHFQAFFALSPLQLAGRDFDDIANPVSGYYSRGEIWQTASDVQSKIYRFSLNDVISAEMLKQYYDELRQSFKAGQLVYAPTSAMEPMVRTWPDIGVPIVYGDNTGVVANYSVYTEGEAYGRIRLYKADALDALSNSYDVGFQDFLVLETAPFDLLSPVAGIITSQPQSIHASHLGLR